MYICMYCADVALCLLSFPYLAQFDKQPTYCATRYQAGPKVVLALLQAYPAAASKPDEVHCGEIWGTAKYALCIQTIVEFK